MKQVLLSVLGVFVWLSFIAFSSSNERDQSTMLPSDSIGNWLLSEKIDLFLKNQQSSSEIEKTGLTKTNYLGIIEKQVKVFQTYQDTSGRIIDPVEKKEKYFTTPCYAHSIAILASSGYTTNEQLIESGMLAMDVVCSDVARGYSEGGHGDFYTWPLMFAYIHFKDIASPERFSKWKKQIASLNPEKYYNTYQKYTNNWNLVHTAGEFLRHKEGFTSLNYVDTCLKNQQQHFSSEGMYNENGNPLAYDLFTRHYITGILKLGYNGTYSETYKKLAWKGAMMSLFMQSPYGEMPAGFRSTHHIWNEAQQCVVFEIYAKQYSKAGNKVMAGAFKRAAMLSLKSITDWIRPDGSGYIVKNRFPIEKKHGYEYYSKHTCYNMLACSMLAQAWQFSENSIPEKASPADLGGFVIPILKPFHKIFANSNGTYIEYETKGDQFYNPTGILRVHIKGSNPQLGPSDGLASFMNSEGLSIALGPSWQDTDGSWTSLAEQKIEPTSFQVLDESPESVKFRIIYDIPNSVSVIETISIKNQKVSVHNEIKGHQGNKRITWPMLVFDGENRTAIELEEKSVSLQLKDKGIKFTIENAEEVKLTVSNSEFNHRNGIIQEAHVEFTGNSITYSLKAN